MNLIRQYCNHVIWMQAGRIVKQGPPDEVVTAYQSASAT